MVIDSVACELLHIMVDVKLICQKDRRLQVENI